MLPEYFCLRSESRLAQLFDRGTILREQLEHPVHAEDDVLRRNDCEPRALDPLRIGLHGSDHCLEVIAAHFESFDAAEVVKVTERMRYCGIAAQGGEVLKQIAAGYDSLSL